MDTVIAEIADRIYRIATFVPDIAALAAHEPRTLATMHGSSFASNGADGLRGLSGIDAARFRLPAAA